MNKLAEQVFRQTLDAMDPATVVRDILSSGNIVHGEKLIDVRQFPSVHVIGTGKASWPMSLALDEGLGRYIEHALAVSSYDPEENHPRIELHKAAHPVPDESSIEAGDKVVKVVESVPENALLLFAISGGTSSLVCRPAGEITVGQLNTTYDLLNNSGASIYEINTVRKHISVLKGGQLLRHLNPSATLLELVISDVPGNEMEIIGSGPTTPDRSTYQDAYHVLLEYELWDKLPETVQRHIEEGIDGVVPDTVKPGEDPIKHHETFMVGTAEKLAHTAAEQLEQRGYNCWVAPEAYNDDVAVVTRKIAEKIIAVDEKETALPLPAALLFYGESTVEVTGSGKGGRNQELALRGALEIAGYENITWLSAGTDGIDGPTDAAGAIVDGKTISKAQAAGLNPREFLANNDAYHFHEQIETLLKTGPTGNNLMDIQIILID